MDEECEPLPYAIGDTVVLKTDREGLERMVVRISISQSDVEYGLRQGASDITWHSEFEVEPQREKNRQVPGFNKG